MKTIQGTKYYTIKEFAIEVELPYSTVYGWLQSIEVPLKQIARRNYIPEELKETLIKELLK